MILQYGRRRSNVICLICKGIVLSLFITVLLCFYVQGTSDFYTLDGNDRDEMVAGQSKKFFLRKEYSLTKPYHGPWNLAGSALITNDFVRLTPDSQSRRGAIFSRLSVHIRHWEAHLNFRVHGSTGNYFGDGLAFWYVDPAVRFPGPVFGGQDRFRGLAVLLDTYSNFHGPQGHFHPYVSAVVNNGSVGFDQQADGEQVAPVGCTVRFRNRGHDTLIAIRYVDDTLAVSTDLDNLGQWLRCFSVKGVHLPTHYVFGISAMTGDLSDNHDVVSMKVYEVESTLNPDDYSGSRRLIEPSIDGLQFGVGKSAAQDSAPDSDTASPTQDGPLLLPVCLSLAGLAALAALALLRHRGRLRRKQRFY